MPKKTIQQRIIKEQGTQQRDASSEIEQRIRQLTDYLLATGSKGYVVGISGGVDSTVAGRLAALAVQRANFIKGEDDTAVTLVAVRLPHGAQVDEDDAQAALDFVDADTVLTVNIAPMVAAMDAAVAGEMDRDLSDFNRGNLKARARMTALYTIAGELGLLVLGTDNAAENAMGFFTKHGDGAFDVNPLAGLTKGQVREMGRYLGASAALHEKVATADLLDANPGRTDEDELGVSYAAIDSYLLGSTVSSADRERIEARWLGSRHKR